MSDLATKSNAALTLNEGVTREQAESELDRLLGKPVGDAGMRDLLFSEKKMDALMRAAEIMASGKTAVPAHLRGSPGDCMAIVMQAAQWGLNPFAVAQKTHIVSGQLGYEAQLVNAVIAARAPVKGRIEYEWFGAWDKLLGKTKAGTGKDGGATLRPAWAAEDEKGCGVMVYATLIGEDKPRELAITMLQAQTRNSPLWASDPKQQLAYLAVKRWARLYVPDVLLGVYSEDELGDLRQEKEEARRPTAVSLNERLRPKPEPAQKEPEPEPSYDAAAALADIKATATTAELKALKDKLAGASYQNDEEQTLVQQTYKKHGAKLSKQEKAADAPPQLPEAMETLAADLIAMIDSDGLADALQALESCEIDAGHKAAIRARLEARGEG